MPQVWPTQLYFSIKSSCLSPVAATLTEGKIPHKMIIMMHPNSAQSFHNYDQPYFTSTLSLAATILTEKNTWIKW